MHESGVLYDIDTQADLKPALSFFAPVYAP